MDLNVFTPEQRLWLYKESLVCYTGGRVIDLHWSTYLCIILKQKAKQALAKVNTDEARNALFWLEDYLGVPATMFPELFAQLPKGVIVFYPWWPPSEKQPRIDALNKAIELTEQLILSQSNPEQ